MSDVLSPSTGPVTRSSTYHPEVTSPQEQWLRSSTEIPIYSTDLVRKRHWLEPVSTTFSPASSNLTEEERYINFWSDFS